MVTIELRDMVRISDFDDEFDGIDRVCSYRPTAYYFIKQRNPAYDGVHFLRNGIFPLGLLERVEQYLKDNRIKYDVIDSRGPAQRLELSCKVLKLRPYQEKAVTEFNKKGIGILNATTGAGKTFLTLEIIRRFATPTIIYVPTKVLLYQWKNEVEKNLGIHCGIIGDGECVVCPVTVAMYQTVAKVIQDNAFTKYVVDEWSMEKDATELKGREDTIVSFMKGVSLSVMDECHTVAARTFIKATINTPSRYKLGLSATSLMRPDGANLAVIAGCGEVFMNITTSELIKDGYLSPLLVKIVSLDKMDKKLKDKELDGKAEYQRIKDEYVQGKDRNKYVVEETKKLLLEEKRTVLVLVTEIAHGRELRKLLEADLGRPVQFLFGQTSGKKRMKVIDELKSGNENLVISTSIFEYGLDIPRLDGLVIASPSKSMIKTIQRVGRILRIHDGKKNAKIVDFDDVNADYFREHFMERMIFYSGEPEFTLEYDGKRKDILALVHREKEVTQFLWEWERKKGRR